MKERADGLRIDMNVGVALHTLSMTCRESSPV